jgi:predicted dehydrogenase
MSFIKTLHSVQPDAAATGYSPEHVPAIAIIGGGQIGSRHLQALARLGRPATVDVIDPAPQSLATARSRFEDVAGGDSQVSLRLHEDLAGLPGSIDVAIVATSSDVRLDVLRGLLANSRVKYLILEKVLFQSLACFAEASRLLAATSTAAWVNCPRRLSPVYSELRDALGGVRPLQVRVSGANWGIGCNSVHFLDLIQFIAGGFDKLSFTSVKLDRGSPAKRAGFLEFTGSLDGRFDSDVSFSLSSYAAGDAPIMIDIDNPAARCVIVEGDGRLSGWRSEASGKWEWRPVSCEFLYQSQLTHLIVRSLLDTGTCALPVFEAAARLHEPLLAVLNRHLFGSLAGNETICPIT